MHTESYVYFLTNTYNNVLYVGVTNNLVRRVYEHKNRLMKGFTHKYNVNRLVYYEVCPDIIIAIKREKQINGWSREKKNNLIITMNPEWKDLYESLF
ncbi:GIY-YIG nuclease family protein [Legionella saoudiensis]|uniref:GIY-YIG nuclease family protein n=1 Tax=Legionella saoudiensis TaxID=1750561 RepID=UPI0007301717|nr:GIY-YIG nuclease family protein [Legionella saoudiensis]